MNGSSGDCCVLSKTSSFKPRRPRAASAAYESTPDRSIARQSRSGYELQRCKRDGWELQRSWSSWIWGNKKYMYSIMLSGHVNRTNWAASNVSVPRTILIKLVFCFIESAGSHRITYVQKEKLSLNVLARIYLPLHAFSDKNDSSSFEKNGWNQLFAHHSQMISQSRDQKISAATCFDVTPEKSG